MTINLFCKKCKSSYDINTKICNKCNQPFNSRNKSYRICVSLDGKRITKVCDNLTLAKEIESTIKSDALREEFNIKPAKKYTLGEIWNKYIEYAKTQKKTWKGDLYLYQKYIEPEFSSLHLDKITVYGLEQFIIKLKQIKTQYKKLLTPKTIDYILKILFLLLKPAF